MRKSAAFSYESPDLQEYHELLADNQTLGSLPVKPVDNDPESDTDSECESEYESDSDQEYDYSSEEESDENDDEWDFILKLKLTE